MIGLFVAFALALSASISYSNNKADSLFGVPFMEMNGPAYLVTGIITILLIGLYIILYKAFGKDEQYEN